MLNRLQRLDACRAKWTFQAGMLAVHKQHTSVHIRVTNEFLTKSAMTADPWLSCDSYTIDITNPATLGCLRAQILEKKGPAYLPYWSPTIGQWEVYSLYGSQRYEHEYDAVLFVLEVMCNEECY